MGIGRRARMSTPRRWHITAMFTVLGLVAMLLSPVIALADTIDVNHLSVNVANINLNVGETANGVAYFVVPANNDGKNGCNLTGGTTLTANVVSNNTGVARVNGTTNTTSISFANCGTTQVVSISAVGPGTATSRTNLEHSRRHSGG